MFVKRRSNAVSNYLKTAIEIFVESKMNLFLLIMRSLIAYRFVSFLFGIFIFIKRCIFYIS